MNPDSSLAFPCLILALGLILYMFPSVPPKLQETGRLMIFIGLFFITQIMMTEM